TSSDAAGSGNHPQFLRAGLSDKGGLAWTTVILLRIRRLGVRVPPSAPTSSQLSALNLPGRTHQRCRLAAFWPHQSSRRPRSGGLRSGPSRRDTSARTGQGGPATRDRWPGVSGGLCVGDAPPAARRATPTSKSQDQSGYSSCTRVRYSAVILGFECP